MLSGHTRRTALRAIHGKRSETEKSFLSKSRSKSLQLSLASAQVSRCGKEGDRGLRELDAAVLVAVGMQTPIMEQCRAQANPHLPLRGDGGLGKVVYLKPARCRGTPHK